MLPGVVCGGSARTVSLGYSVILSILTHLAVALICFCIGALVGLLMAHRLVGVVLNKELAAKLGAELRKQRNDCGGMSATNAPVAAGVVSQNGPPNPGPGKGPGALSPEAN